MPIRQPPALSPSISSRTPGNALGVSSYFLIFSLQSNMPRWMSSSLTPSILSPTSLGVPKVARISAFAGVLPVSITMVSLSDCCIASQVSMRVPSMSNTTYPYFIFRKAKALRLFFLFKFFQHTPLAARDHTGHVFPVAYTYQDKQGCRKEFISLSTPYKRYDQVCRGA